MSPDWHVKTSQDLEPGVKSKPTFLFILKLGPDSMAGHGLDELRAMAGGREARLGWWCQCSGSGDERGRSRLEGFGARNWQDWEVKVRERSSPGVWLGDHWVVMLPTEMGTQRKKRLGNVMTPLEACGVAAPADSLVLSSEQWTRGLNPGERSGRRPRLGVTNAMQMVTKSLA